VLPSEQAVGLPANVPMEAGACLGIPAYTGYQAVLRAGAPRKGPPSWWPPARGAVGHYAIQFAKQRKATVITTVSSPAKAEIARQAGADHVIDYKREDVGERVMALTAKRGVDAVIEMDLAANARLLPNVLAPNGVVAIYGSGAAETVDSVPVPAPEQHHATVLPGLPDAAGRAERATADITRLLGRGDLIHNVAQTFDFGDMVAAHEAVESGKAMGNIVVKLA
jgi:NADPH2:quinone reductase